MVNTSCGYCDHNNVPFLRNVIPLLHKIYLWRIYQQPESSESNVSSKSLQTTIAHTLSPSAQTLAHLTSRHYNDIYHTDLQRRPAKTLVLVTQEAKCLITTPNCLQETLLITFHGFETTLLTTLHFLKETFLTKFRNFRGNITHNTPYLEAALLTTLHSLERKHCSKHSIVQSTVSQPGRQRQGNF